MLLLDALAQLYPDSSRTTLRQMLQSSRVRVNGETEKDAKRMVEPDEMLAVMAKADQRVPPSGIAILHEDRDVIVILKSHGLLTVAPEREREATAQAYLNTYLGSRGEDRVHVVHRLDRETSGVLVFAKRTSSLASSSKRSSWCTASSEVYVAVIEE